MNATTDTTNDGPTPKKRKKALLAVSALFILAGAAYGAWYLIVGATKVDTDNAYVGGNLVTLSSQVAGSVVDIAADETQMVKAGAELVRLDPTDAQVALSQAEARLGAAVRQQRERFLNLDQLNATITERRVALAAAKADLARRQPLVAEQIVSGEDIAHARRAVDTANAQLNVALTQLASAKTTLAGVTPAMNPSVQAARADYTAAWLAVRRNTVVAPVSGYVAKRSVQVGSRITPGAPLLSIVPLEQLWVDANYKESELKDIRVGQPATVEADMYGSKVEFHGRVLGLSAGTGSAFSLLPAQNASGNWIKVVQRLPVRIALDPKELAAHPLRVGLSATVSIDITGKNGGALGTLATPAHYATDALAQPLGQAQAAADRIIAGNMVH
ncbi:MAG: HlyD family efflux transporter periplasmic adaptor subunit [Massilia sp.]